MKTIYFCKRDNFSIENIKVYWYNGGSIFFRDLPNIDFYLSHYKSIKHIEYFIKHFGCCIVKCVPNCEIFKKLYPEYIEWGNKLLVKGE